MALASGKLAQRNACVFDQPLKALASRTHRRCMFDLVTSHHFYAMTARRSELASLSIA